MNKSLCLLSILLTPMLLPAQTKKPEEATVLGALDAVAKTIEPTDELDVIDYVSAAYGSHGYYETGGWDDPSPFSRMQAEPELPAWIQPRFCRPVDGRITSGYGFRPAFGRLHRGIDLALNVGDTIKAALPGVVERIGYDMGGYGRFVIIRHENNVETRYAHLQKSLSVPGQKVNAGDPIATGGNSGNSTGPHLHFETRYLGTPVNPVSLF